MSWGWLGLGFRWLISCSINDTMCCDLCGCNFSEIYDGAATKLFCSVEKYIVNSMPGIDDDGDGVEAMVEIRNQITMINYTRNNINWKFRG